MIPKYTFLVWVDCKKYRFFQVMIWEDKFTLRKAVGATDDTVGLCQSFTVRNYGKTKPKTVKIGEIHFCMERLGSGIVAHEFTHALFHVQKTLRIKAGRSKNGEVGLGEESLCRIMGNMISQFYTQAWDRHIFGQGRTILND